MNYSTDSFIIDIGQFLQTIMFKAPYINGSPLDYNQTKRIFNAVHESVFNSVFPWANINNHPMDVIEEVYQGFQIRAIVDGHVYQYLGQDDQGKPQYSNPIKYDVSNRPRIRSSFQTERDLPVVSTPGTYYLVGGEFLEEQWVTYLTHMVLEPIGIELKKAILRHAGTRRKHEWHFDYVSNGIFYQLASTKPSVVAPTINRLSEQELINQVILDLQAPPKRNPLLNDQQLLAQFREQLENGVLPAPKRPEVSYTVDIREYGNDEKMQQVYQHAVGLLNHPSSHGAKLNITVTYTVQGYFDKLVTFINQFIEMHRLDIVVGFKPDWSSPLPVISKQVQPVVDHTALIGDKLRQLRQAIVKSNRISDNQALELQSLAPELYRMGFTPNDLAELMNVDDPTLRFYGKDPMLIDQNVIMMCMAIDRYLDGPALPKVMVQQPMVQEVPLAAVNMNGLLRQELQEKLNRIDPSEPAYVEILQRIQNLGTEAPR